MNAHDGWLGVNVSHNERDGRLHGLAGGVAWSGQTLEAEDSKMSPARGEIRFGNLLHAFERHIAIIDSLNGEEIHALSLHGSRICVRLP